MNRELEQVAAGMSQALYGTLTAQEQEIRRLKWLEKSHKELCGHATARVNTLGMAAFAVLKHPENEDCRTNLRNSLLAAGFCPCCERRPCDCEDLEND